MLRYLVVAAILVPNFAFAADMSTSVYIEGDHSRRCPRAQDGTQYCVEGPVERRITDCNFGVACYHEQSGQHYTVQHPIILD